MIEKPEPGKLVLDAIAPGVRSRYQQNCAAAFTTGLVTESCLPYFISMDELVRHRDFWIIPGRFLKNKNESLDFFIRGWLCA